MGKIVKLDKGKSAVVKLNDGKKISVYLAGNTVRVVELGFLDTENTTICSKDTSLFEAIVAVLAKSKTLSEARRMVLVLKPGDGAKQEELTEEKEEDEDPPQVPVAGPLAKWMTFQNVAESLCIGAKDLEHSAAQAKEAILEAASVYSDKRHPQQAKVQGFFDDLKFKGLVHEKSGYVILGNFYAGLATIPDFQEDAEKLRGEYIAHVQKLRRGLRSAFFHPPNVPMPSCFDDLEGAKELQAMAADYAEKKNFEGAIDLMRKAVRRAPNYIELYYLMSEYYLLEDNVEDAIGALEMMESIEDKDTVLGKSDYYLLLVTFYSKVRTPDEMQPILLAIRHLALKHNIPADEIETVMRLGGWRGEPEPAKEGPAGPAPEGEGKQGTPDTPRPEPGSEA